MFFCKTARSGSEYERLLIHHCASFMQGLERIRDFPNLAKLSNKERSNCILDKAQGAKRCRKRHLFKPPLIPQIHVNQHTLLKMNLSYQMLGLKLEMKCACLRQ